MREIEQRNGKKKRGEMGKKSEKLKPGNRCRSKIFLYVKNVPIELLNLFLW